VRFIYQAVEHGRRFYREDLHNHEKGIALLTALFVNSKRDKKKKAAQPSDYHYFPLNNQVEIPGIACDTFFALAEDELLPDWALGLAPLDNLRNSRAHGEPPKQRAWYGADILLIMPEVHQGKVSAAIAMLDGVEDESLTVFDIDTEEEFEIVIPPELIGQRSWVLNFESVLEQL